MEVKMNPNVEKQQGLVHILSWHEKTQKGNYTEVTYPYYLLHLVLDGEGSFHMGGNTYYPRRGDAFLIYPETDNFYCSDNQNPWEYVWVQFHGNECESICSALGFSREHPVCSFRNIDKLRELHQNTEQIPFDTPGQQIEHKIRLYELFKEMMENRITDQSTNTTKQELYYQQAIQYIANHLDDPSLSAEKVAEQVHICRKYLLTVFQKHGQTTSTYIQNQRLERAKQLLTYTTMAVGEIAMSCGYPNLLTFSRMFKTKIGMSPRAYRNTTIGHFPF
ncbi:MAG: AraC family transcriptional regulator [Clostridia bacterium]|nr:AraC family transcriptional regulator [Clostridia bacterium]